MIFIIHRDGVKVTGKLIKYLLIIPMVLLIILLIRGLTLPGAY